MPTSLDKVERTVLALDGFDFKDDQVDASVSNALKTPLHGVLPGEDTIYHNLLGLITSALLFREGWEGKSRNVKARFASDISRHWGISTEVDQLGIWETHLNGKKQPADDTAIVTQAIRDIHKSVKLPKFITETPKIIRTRTVLPDVYCTNFLNSMQEDEASLHGLNDEDKQHSVASVVCKILGPTGQLMVEEIIGEAQRPGQTSRDIRSHRDHLLDEFRDTISDIHQLEQKAKHIATELGVWKPRLLGFTHDNWVKYHGPDRKNSVPVEGQTNISVLAENRGAEVTAGSIPTMPIKRDHDGRDGPNPKRIRMNKDGVDKAPDLPSRRCTVM
ncbi:hypothetical protein F4806DRAFT_496612 [Annulohypoxylon nitens]|nr:hypothetical protein F4806DRAFT_496612 [Annulohypoxylon nitens]